MRGRGISVAGVVLQDGAQGHPLMHLRTHRAGEQRRSESGERRELGLLHASSPPRRRPTCHCRGQDRRDKQPARRGEPKRGRRANLGPGHWGHRDPRGRSEPTSRAPWRAGRQTPRKCPPGPGGGGPRGAGAGAAAPGGQTFRAWSPPLLRIRLEICCGAALPEDEGGSCCPRRPRGARCIRVRVAWLCCRRRPSRRHASPAWQEEGHCAHHPDGLHLRRPGHGVLSAPRTTKSGVPETAADGGSEAESCRRVHPEQVPSRRPSRICRWPHSEPVRSEALIITQPELRRHRWSVG